MKRKEIFTLLAAPLAAIFGTQVLGQNTTSAPSTATKPVLVPDKARAKHVFVVSFDGGKPSVMKQSKMPLTMTMAKNGAVTWNAQTIFPSTTLPSHTSMLTGVGPAKHKVLWNDHRPELGPIKVTTAFEQAKKKGLKTALFAGKSKFHHLEIPGSLDKFAIPAYAAKTVANAAAQYIISDKPNLCFVHFADSDGAGHKYGWGSPEQIKAFEDEDEALKTLQDAVQKAGIARDSVFILTADHGGHAKTHGSNSPEDMTIPWIAYGTSVKPGTDIKVPVVTYDSAATALWLLGVPIPGDWDGKPVTSAFE
jgi:predicted AlkP superfamily pyrophosphatase or phosphodiesterase